MKIALVLLSGIIIATCQTLCPPSENIKPCICSEDSMTCNNLKSAAQLIDAVSNMKGYSISSFYLKNSNISILPSDVFSGVAIHYLSIDQCNLTRLGENRNRPPFIGLENSLQVLEIKKSFFDKNMPLASLSLSHLKKLYSLYLIGNIIPTIGNNWFESGPYGLKQLTVTNTETAVIGSHAFEAFGNLEYFRFNGGLRPEITREMFSMPATFLQSIDLTNNKLTTLPPNFFTKMPSLEHIYLNSNYFTTIDEVIFAPVWNQLDSAYFHGNPIKCNSDLKWVYKYRLPKYFEGYCTSPDKLLYKNLKNITISDLE